MLRHLRLSLLLVGLALVAACNSPTPKAKPLPPLPAGTPPPITTLAVHTPSAEPKVWEVEIAAAMTVRNFMDLLKDAQFAFTDTLYPGMGHLVTSVAGIRNAGGEGAYWQFCINNVASDRGVDEMEVVPGGRVDWHYARYGELPCKKIGE